MEQKMISQAVLSRLPAYLAYLKALPRDASAHISATSIAKGLDMGEVQVRKDLAAVCDGGKPKTGYVRMALINGLESFLGYNDVDDAVIVGAGKLGAALLHYEGFGEVGIQIVAAFDRDERLVSREMTEKPILPMSRLGDLCKRMQIRIGIITVPAEEAQGVCDKMVESGIMAIMNFAPVHLKAPEDILIQTENIASSLALLSKNLTERLYKK